MTYRNRQLLDLAKYAPCCARFDHDCKPGTVVSAHMNVDKRVAVCCANCSRAFDIPKCRVSRANYCSIECRIALQKRISEEKKAQRQRTCKQCGSNFTARPFQLKIGQGIFCSAKCRSGGMVGRKQTKEEIEKRTISIRKAMAEGRLIHPSGADNPRWKGGRQESYKRALADGTIAKRTREYRAKNPHKTREFDQKRRGRKTGRLPRGTVKSLFNKQRGRCANCTIGLPANYHVDHIVPLARGGSHEPLNLQLLCPSCNVKKSARDPFVFAQMNGRLL